MFDSFKIYKDERINGRAGRLSRQACCYLLLPADKAIDEKAKKRLNVISKFTNLGFDLYCRLLKDSIKKLTKNENLKNTDELIRTYVNSPPKADH